MILCVIFATFYDSSGHIVESDASRYLQGVFVPALQSGFSVWMQIVLFWKIRYVMFVGIGGAEGRGGESSALYFLALHKLKYAKCTPYALIKTDYSFQVFDPLLFDPFPLNFLLLRPWYC